MRSLRSLLLTTTLLLALAAGFRVPGVASSAAGEADAPAQEAADGSAAPETGPVVSGAGHADEDDEEGEEAAPLRALRSELLRYISGNGRDQWGVLVVSLDRGDTLFSFRSDAPLTPASNMKLFTTAAALHYLGPAYRYGTYVLSSAPVTEGVLEGDLHVYGTGDPSISGTFHSDDRAVWRSLADTLRSRGIVEVRGDIVGDASWFDSPSVPQGWQDGYRSADYAAPASALSYHENTISLRVLPGEEPGWRPRVDRIPGGRGIALVNLATTTAGGDSRIRVERLAYDGPIVVEGRIPRGHAAIWREVPVADPARYAAAVFREALEERGVRVHGTVRSQNEPRLSPVGSRRVFAPAFQEAPVPRVLAVHTSPPLQAILSVINHESHNQFAEQVLRTVGRVVMGDGSPEGGARAVYAFLRDDVGVPAEEVRMYDGSGLSVLNRVTAGSVIALLSHMAASPHRAAYQATLPVAGTREGLRRMYDGPAQNNLRAKTGTIRNVSALSGYVTASDGERLGFSIIGNDLRSTWAAKGVENRIGVELARFARGVAGEERSVAAEPVTAAGPGEAPGAAAAPRATDARPTTGTAAPAEHTIRPGDTLEAIGKRYGVSVAALREANPGLNPRRMIPGRTVKLPPGS